MILVDPLVLVNEIWPDIKLYDKQVELLYSVIGKQEQGWGNLETICIAGNMLGKDFSAALIALVFFLTRHPCRVVTTSVDQHQLEKVLWGEMKSLIANASRPLPLEVQSLNIYKIVNGDRCPKSYITGRVASKENEGAGLLGHHLPRGAHGEPHTLAIVDEASGFIHEYWQKLKTWARCLLAIGNPFPCDNFFRYADEGDPRNPTDKGGDIMRPRENGYVRKIIRITATDSPNVDLALRQIKSGMKPTNEIIIPGVLDYDEYLTRLDTWDEHMKTASLWARWYKGAQLYLFPREWLEECCNQYDELLKRGRRQALSMGVDPAEGGDSSAWCIGDRLGILYRHSCKTPDTMDVQDITERLMKEFNLKGEQVWFDRGGGKQHADALRRRGHAVNTVGFGETVRDEPKYGLSTVKERRRNREESYAFKNRRTQMYWVAREMIQQGYGISKDEDRELLRQLGPIPLSYDSMGRFYLLPKHVDTEQDEDRKGRKRTLKDIIGCSPDEADAFVLMIHGLVTKSLRKVAGAV